MGLKALGSPLHIKTAQSRPSIGYFDGLEHLKKKIKPEHLIYIDNYLPTIHFGSNWLTFRSFTIILINLS